MADLDLDKVVLKLTVGDRPYEIPIAEFSAMDELDYQRATGSDLITPFTTGQINSILLAGLLWLYRRRFEKQLRFETVAKELKWESLGSVEITGMDDEEAPPLPKSGSDPEG